MDSGSFMQRVCELTGFDPERSELLVQEALVMLGTRTSPGEADSPTICELHYVPMSPLGPGLSRVDV
jgi:hypothetical protein